MSLEEIVFGKQNINDSDEEENKNIKKKNKNPVWVDPDDLTLLIPPEKAKMYDKFDPVSGEVFSKELQERFNKTTENIDISWTIVDEKKPSTIDAEDLFSHSTTRIPSDNLVILRLNDLYEPKKGKVGIRQIEFDPTQNQMSILDGNGIIHVISVGEKKSSLLFDLPFNKEIPIRKCLSYSSDGIHLFVGCAKGQFQAIDLRLQTSIITKVPNFNDDIIFIQCSSNNKLLCLLSNRSIHFFDPFNRSHLKTIETSDHLLCGCFSDDSKYFITAGKNGRGLLIDCDNLKAINRFQDSEMQHIRSISISNNRVAIGTESGVLQVYELNELKKNYPKSIFNKLNLVTAIDNVKFNPTGELIIFSSSDKIDSLKILHLASKKVYSNWPTAKTPLSYVRSIAFNSNSQWFAYGNEKGYVRLWELSFYKKIE